jgi:hypothetical protein
LGVVGFVSLGFAVEIDRFGGERLQLHKSNTQQ